MTVEFYFRNKMFVPEVGQLKLRFIQKSHDDPAAGHPGKTKTYEILSRYYYWPGIIDDVKRFVKNFYGCRKNKTFRDKYHGALMLRPRTRAVFILRTSLCNRCHDQLVVY